ncbi:MAG: hypothetical protein ACJ8G7_14835 [Rhizobacter sp.]
MALTIGAPTATVPAIIAIEGGVLGAEESGPAAWLALVLPPPPQAVRAAARSGETAPMNEDRDANGANSRMFLPFERGRQRQRGIRTAIGAARFRRAMAPLKAGWRRSREPGHARPIDRGTLDAADQVAWGATLRLRGA